MKNLIYLICILFFATCAAPREEFVFLSRNELNETNLAADEYFLKQYKATSSKNSVLFFTHGFTGEQLNVVNCDSLILKQPIKTSESQPVAKILVINNTCVTKISDSSHQIYRIKPDLALKYKFIYIHRDHSKNKRYYVKYTNKYRGFF